jgi:ABC-type nickel/cobalt efflux system permease component RcnA
MHEEVRILAVTAASIGFLHTLLGPDHYLPFIMMARAGKWSSAKTAVVTVFCGIGHVMSSVLLGFAGILLGTQLSRLEAFESARGEIAAWLLIVFGLVYFIWGVRRAVLNKPHRHVHMHHDGMEHEHTHDHHDAHAHAHIEKAKPNYTPWVLFVIFVLGPCEPLIPLLMYPAARHDMGSVVLVGTVFSVVTIGTMLGTVMLALAGVRFVRLGSFERYSHALAGAIIMLSGVGIQFLGL